MTKNRGGLPLPEQIHTPHILILPDVILSKGRSSALRTLEGPLVKRLRFHDERWWASSDNDSSENGSHSLDGDDKIIGRVVWWAHMIVEGEPQPASE